MDAEVLGPTPANALAVAGGAPVHILFKGGTEVAAVTAPGEQHLTGADTDVPPVGIIEEPLKELGDTGKQ